MKKTILYWTALLAWIAMAVFLSRQTGGETIQLSGGIANQIAKLLAGLNVEISVQTLHTSLRMTAHIVIYLVLGFLAYKSITLVLPKQINVALVVAVCIAAAVLDEYQKVFIPGRHCEWDEAALNCVGSMVGVLVARLFP